MNKPINKETAEMKVNYMPTVEQIVNRHKGSKLAKSQFLLETKEYFENGEKYRICVRVRYDDECNNGHNTFAITGEIDRKAKNNRWYEDRCGCIHDDIVKHFPELRPFIKWHLTSSDGPIYYVSNSLYHAGFTQWKDARNEANLKSSSIYGALESDNEFNLMKAGEEELRKWLLDRHAPLMKEFRKAVESLGLIY